MIQATDNEIIHIGILWPSRLCNVAVSPCLPLRDALLDIQGDRALKKEMVHCIDFLGIANRSSNLATPAA